MSESLEFPDNSSSLSFTELSSKPLVLLPPMTITLFPVIEVIIVALVSLKGSLGPNQKIFHLEKLDLTVRPN